MCRFVSPYAAEMWPCVERLPANTECIPWASSRYGRAAATRLHQARTAKLLANADTQAWLALDAEYPVGIGALVPLAWDTEQIGMSAARLDGLQAQGDYQQQRDTVDAILNILLEQAQAQAIRHVSVRVDAGDFALIHALEAAGMQLMDGLLTFTLDLTQANLPEPNVPFRLRFATPDDADQAARMGHGLYRHDRFHADPAIAPERADAVHACWLRNSCLGVAADAVVLAESKSGMEAELLGFVTCKLHSDAIEYFGVPTASIVLVGVTPGARGQGVTQAATFAALRWMRAQGVEMVEVGTQMRNIAAGRVYEHCGFRLSGSSLTFRKLL